jgi:hypothetical protein
VKGRDFAGTFHGHVRIEGLLFLFLSLDSAQSPASSRDLYDGSLSQQREPVGYPGSLRVVFREVDLVEWWRLL